MIFLTLLLIPILVDLGFLTLGGKNFSIKKFLFGLLVEAVFTLAVVGVVSCQNTSDTEVWNGRITKKAKERVSCSHSYTCNCVTVCSGSGRDQSCTEICQTCYEHSYDIDWAVYTTLGNRFTIDRVSRQGLEKPSRWEIVVIGEPYSDVRTYTNYVKGASDTLFRHQGLTEKFKGMFPGYPQNVYDYYRLNRLVEAGLTVPDIALWNRDLMELNADLGAKKQVNTLIVIAKNQPEEYFYALEQEWIGGKKNDVVLVVSVDDENKILWANTMAWTDNKIFQVALRDSVVATNILNREKIMGVLRDGIESNFVRKPMKDFEYLSRTIKPTTTQWMISMILGLLLSIGLNIFLEKNEFN
jgi:hypothetical protein